MFSVHDEVRNTTHYYVWNESIAARGPYEIASSLYKHFIKNLPPNTQKIILFCDFIKISLMLKKFFDYSKLLQLHTIEQHFSVTGHSKNSCDRSHQILLSQLKPDTIFVPSDMINLIERANKTEPTFIVNEMKKEDFYSSEILESLVLDGKCSNDGKQIRWSNYQKIIYERQRPLSLDFFEYGGTSATTVSLQNTCTPEEFSATKLRYLYANTREIALSKNNDLQALLKYVTPAEECERVAKFYHGLNQDDSTKDFALDKQIESDEDDCSDENT